MENGFKFDQLRSNCDYILDYCARNDNEFNRSIIASCKQLLESAQIVERVAPSYTFENIPKNGFLIYLKVITSYTEKLTDQIKNKNKIDKNFIKLFPLILKYKELIHFVHQKLENEQKNKSSSNRKSLFLKECALPDKPVYEMVNFDEEVTRIMFAWFVGFWLPDEIRRLLNFFNFCFAFGYNIPISSVASLFSRESRAKYCSKSLRNANLHYPFTVWHQPEGFFVAKFMNYVLNRNVPVSSVTLNIPKQHRYRLDYKGNLHDFESMKKEEIEMYFNEKEEQDRQNSPGMRHRNNKETIFCRYSYITSEEKVIESLENIKKQTQNYKVMKHCSARKFQNAQKKPQTTNQISQLNIYEPNELIRTKLNLNSEKVKNIKYNGPKYNIVEEEGDFKEIPLQNDCTKIDIEKFDFNPDRILIIYIHGGAFVSQEPRSCELFLRSWVNNLGGVPVLAIHYSLACPFPVCNQEVLDVYLWALSGGQDVKDCLGYHPKSIIFCGDSAGGFFSITLAITVNELNKKYNLSIPLPLSMNLFYPVFGLKCVTPGRSLSILEPLVAFHPLFLILALLGTNRSSNGDFEKLRDTDEKYRQLEESNRRLFSNEDVQVTSMDKTRKSKKNDMKPWFACDYPVYKSRAEYMKSYFENPFITPIIYEHLDELKDIDLFIGVGELDFFNDDSIEIANKWKGNVSLDVFENMIHGYLYFDRVSRNCKEAADLSLIRLQEACGLRCDKLSSPIM